MSKPLCFVLMPFGEKLDATGNKIDFDKIYQEIISPAIKNTGLEPLRADEEMSGGIIHKPMYERLILCEYAVADLTTANANVFYELGLRHAIRPWSTVLIFANGERLPFDVGPLRALPYNIDKKGGPSSPAADIQTLTKRLEESRNSAITSRKGLIDSPLYQLVEDYPDIDHEKTDVFRDRVQYAKEIKKSLAKARTKGVEAVQQIEIELANKISIKEQESGVVIDLFLSYRAVKGWENMVELVKKMSRPLAKTVLVQEQYALALNRNGKGVKAEQVLKQLLDKRGDSSETLGILGRVYKDRWETAVKTGKKIQAKTLLEKSIDAYLKGFEADFRDAYPGINAVTLMQIKEPPDPRFEKVFPVVFFAVEQRVTKGTPDYWDYATLLELSVLNKDKEKAFDFTGEALEEVREIWEPETTMRNLGLIREAREKREEEIDWIKEIEDALFEKQKEMKEAMSPKSS